MTCDRLTQELAVLDAMRHTQPEDRDRRETDHARWCPVCSGRPPEPLTPRDPEEKL